MKELTIFTPTYNRAHLLIKLYNSLQNQSDKSFVWIVVDDGSTDNTEEIVKGFIDKKQIDVEYYKKANGGKHTAINFGVPFIKTAFTCIVDSDDELTTDAVSVMTDYIEKYKNHDDIACISFLRQRKNGKIYVGKEIKADFIDFYNHYRIFKNNDGDMAEIFKTDILREYPFPVYDNEKFVSEDVVWIEISKKYKTLYTNKAVYVSEYLKTGLTYSRKKLNATSPHGAFNNAKQYMTIQTPLLLKLKKTVQGLVYGKMCGLKVKNIKKELNSKWTGVLVLPSLILYSYYKKKYCKSVKGE